MGKALAAWHPVLLPELAKALCQTCAKTSCQLPKHMTAYLAVTNVSGRIRGSRFQSPALWPLPCMKYGRWKDRGKSLSWKASMRWTHFVFLTASLVSLFVVRRPRAQWRAIRALDDFVSQRGYGWARSSTSEEATRNLRDRGC